MKTLRSCLKIRNTHFYIIRWGGRLTHFIFLFLCSITFSTCCTTWTASTTCSFPFSFFLIRLTFLIVFSTFLFLISLSTFIKIFIKVNIQNIN